MRMTPPAFKKLFAGVILMGMLSIPRAVAIADQCLSLSPSITQMGQTPYSPIKIRDLTGAEFKDLSILFQSLSGDWHGTAEDFFCRSNSDPSDITIERSTIRAKVRVDRTSNLNLSANLYSESNRTSFQKDVRLYLNDHQLRLNNDNSTGNVELLTVSGSKVAFFTRHALQTGTSGRSARQELFFTITKRSDEFTIEMRLYVLGKLSSGYTWNFSKK